MDIRDAILRWLAHGQTGTSSKAMAFTAAGIDNLERSSYPHDPSDFNRCLLLVEAVPEIRLAFHKIAELSPQWSALLNRWDDLEDSFIREVGPNWSLGRSAPKTYKLMKEILSEQD